MSAKSAVLLILQLASSCIYHQQHAGQDFHIELFGGLLLSLNLEVSQVNIFPAQFTMPFLYSYYLIIMSSSGGYTGTGTKPDLANHSNQCNPNNRNYQGHDSSYTGTGTKPDLGNHSNQCNPNNPNYQAQKK